MPVDLKDISARSKMVEFPGVGALVIREATLADVQRSNTDPNWWVSCVSCPDGTPFLSNPQEAGQIRAELAGAILAEINHIRPTHAPSEGCSASATTKVG